MHFLKSTKNPGTLSPSAKAQPQEGAFVMHVCNIRQRQRRPPNTDLSAARTNCHDTRRDRTGRRCPRPAAFICISQPPLPLPQELRAITACNRFPSANPPSISSATSMLWILWTHKRRNNELLHKLVGCTEQNRRPPRTRPSPVAASPTDLSRGKHTHTSVRPTCYTS